MNSVLDLLQLPSVERVPLAKSPLILALCQVKFATVLGVAETAFVAPFHRAIRAKYPIANPGVQLQVDTEEHGIRSSQSPYWEFTDLAGIWKVVLAPTFLSLETRNYTDFGEFTDRLRVLLGALVEHIQPPIGTRVGLRYINEVRPGKMAWSDAISRDVLGPVAVSAVTANAEHISSVQQLSLRYAGNQGINITHGVIPRGTTIRLRPGEHVPDESFYLLDFDVFQDFPIPDGLPMDPDRICDYVEAYHTLVYRLFRWSVTNQYLTSLGRK